MTLILDDFSGGLNLRDSPNQIGLNETPDALNWTLDERGALKWRKGCLNQIALPGVAGTPAWIFYSIALDQWLCVRETSGAPNTYRLHTRAGDFSGIWTDRGSVQGGLVAFADMPSPHFDFVDFPGNPPRVVISSGSLTIGDGGGTYTWNGSTLTLVSGPISGTCLALWQNRVWLAGFPADNSDGNRTTLFYSALGDPATWNSATQKNDLRDKDAEPLRALGVAGGVLCAFKKRSAYRVYDSNTGAYTLIDASQGCVGPSAFVAIAGRLYAWGVNGITAFDGVGPGHGVGDRVQPLIVAATDEMPGVCAGAGEGRAVFAYPSGASTNNDRLLEYSPEHDWLMRHQLAAAGQNEISSFSSKGTGLYGAVTDGDDLFKMFSETPGADDGVVFTANHRTPWLQLHEGKLARLQKLAIQGLVGTTHTTTKLKLRIYKDWDETTFADEFEIDDALRGGDAGDRQEETILRSLGHSKAFQLELVADTAAGDVAVRSYGLDATALER